MYNIYSKGEGKNMEKLIKITDGKIKRLEKRFLKIVKSEYKEGDGTLYCNISNINITCLDGNLIQFIVRYGRISETEEEKMDKKVSIYAGDGNITFLAGQFFQAIQILDEYGIDGNE